jgi:Fis family transcriptional regulator
MTKTVTATIKPQFNHAIEQALNDFLSHNLSHLPTDLHALAMKTFEKPLLKLIMKRSEYNQSKAAKILGLNRATLRKKLIEHGIIEE